MSHNKQYQTGFTIIELTLAMAFVSLLLLAVAGVVTQIGNIYNKGVTMKSVNQAGRLVVADMKSAISEGSAFVAGTGYVPDNGSDGQPARGRLCTGKYSYVWNVGRSDTPSTPLMRYDDAGNTRVGLAKIKDATRKYCEPIYNNPATLIPRAEATELLSQGDLAVQAFAIDSVTGDSTVDTTIYRIKLAISNADTTWLNSDRQCSPPSEENNNDNFCAVNEFVFTAQSGRGGGN